MEDMRSLMAFAEREVPNLLINLGCLMDIPTATFSTGKSGETLYNAGLSSITAICGLPNSYKSTISHYMLLSATSKIYESNKDTSCMTYDTETNTNLERLNSLGSHFPIFGTDVATSSDSPWILTGKKSIAGNVWADGFYKMLESKTKTKDVEIECFKDPYSDNKNPKPYKAKLPTFVEVDSFSEFEADSTTNLLTGDLDDSSTQTYAMKQGLFKTKFMSQLPRLLGKSNTYMLLTAHMGSKVDISSNPYAPKPSKQLQYLKLDQHIKGVGSKFGFLATTIWLANTGVALDNKGTKLAEYPKDPDDQLENDLNIVKLVNLKNKNGITGGYIEVVVSQQEGVLPTLTEFRFVKGFEYGIAGNKQNYQMVLYPNLNLSRTTIRTKIRENLHLRRAINITAELLQLKIYKPELKNILLTPEELFNKVKDLGYDWEVLLGTRGYWTINQYTNPIPYLSTVDLLKMVSGTYHPYFLDKDKKLKPKYKTLPNKENENGK